MITKGSKVVFTNMTDKETEYYNRFPMVVIEDNGNRVIVEGTNPTMVIQSQQVVMKADLVEAK